MKQYHLSNEVTEFLCSHMRIKFSNSAFHDTEVQEIILSVVQLELNHLDRPQLRYKARVFYTCIYIVRKWMENLISTVLQLVKVLIFFLIVAFGTMLPRLDNDTIRCIINQSSLGRDSQTFPLGIATNGRRFLLIWKIHLDTVCIGSYDSFIDFQVYKLLAILGACDSAEILLRKMA